MHIHAHGGGHVARDGLLQRVVGGDVVLQAPTVLYTQRHKTRVLAAAVVVPLVIGDAIGRSFVHQHVGARHMAAAAQHLVVLPRLGEHGLCRLHVHVFTVVAGAQHGQLRLAEAKGLGAPGLHERQSLQCLERGTGEVLHVRIAHIGLQFVTCIDHGNGAKVNALGHAAAAELDEGGKIAGGHTHILSGEPSVGGVSAQTPPRRRKDKHTACATGTLSILVRSCCARSGGAWF